jgi:vitamin B12 transporter
MPRHGGLFWAAIILAIAVSEYHAFAQTTVRISGTVCDALDGSPIEHARVSIDGTTYWTLTDQFGAFLFENVPTGRHRLIAEASAYYARQSDEIDVSADITRLVNMALERRIRRMGERIVSGEAVRMGTEAVAVISRDEIRRTEAKDLSDVLRRLEGVFLQETGPAGGRVRVSIRGCAPEHVLILVDGLRVNSAADGEADLNLIPIASVERVEVHRGGESARFGADALGGVINISTIPRSPQESRRFESTKAWGKWKTSRFDMTVINPVPIDKLTDRFAFAARSSNGDFPYFYKVSSVTDVGQVYEGIRHNADVTGKNYFASAHYQPTAATSLGFSAQLYDSKQGLPGAVSRPDPVARKQDQRLLCAVQFMNDPSSRYGVESSAGYTRYLQEFDNRAHPVAAQRYYTRFRNDVATVDLIGHLRLIAGNHLTIGAAGQHDILYHDDILRPQAAMGRTVRENLGLFISARHAVDRGLKPICDQAVIDGALRWDNSATRNCADRAERFSGASNWSEKIGLSLTRGGRARVTVRSSYGTSYRLPTVNALFWKADVRSQGNPALRPERAEHSDVGVEFSAGSRARISVGTTYFHSYVKDMIVWQPGSQGDWKPANLEAALLTGHEDFLHLSIGDDRLVLDYRNTITTPLNKKQGGNSYGRDLTYRPRYVTQVECAARWSVFRGSYSVRLVDRRHALEANTLWYDAYRIDNLLLGVETGVAEFHLKASCHVDNIRGEEYVLIGGYPMPGRQWGIDVALSYELGS